MTKSATARDAASYPLRLALPLFLFFVIFFLIPLMILAWMSLHVDRQSSQIGLDQYLKFLGDEFSVSVLFSTLWVGVESTLLCLILGFPLAWVFMKSPAWLRSALMLAILMPLLTSVVVRTFAWIVILGRQGIVNETLIGLGLISTPLHLLYTEGGLVVALAQVLLPLMVLPLITAQLRIDTNLADASFALGGGHWRTFFKVTVPLSLPGIMAGCLLTYAAAVTAFITQSLVGGGQKLYMPMYIYQQVTSLQDWPFASAISIILLGAVLAIVWILNRLGRLSQGLTQS